MVKKWPKWPPSYLGLKLVQRTVSVFASCCVRVGVSVTDDVVDGKSRRRQTEHSEALTKYQMCLELWLPCGMGGRETLKVEAIQNEVDRLPSLLGTLISFELLHDFLKCNIHINLVVNNLYHHLKTKRFVIVKPYQGLISERYVFEQRASGCGSLNQISHNW